MVNKAQSNIISVVIIVTISIIVVSGTFYWIIPSINEISSASEIDRLEKQMLDLHRNIVQTSREQSQRSLNFRIPGGSLKIRDHSILYKGDFQLPESEIKQEAIVYGGVDTGNYTNCSENAIGRLGEDESVCLLERGNFELELRYLKLEDTFNGDTYQIGFVTSSKSHGSKGNRQIVIKWVNKTIDGSNPKNVTKNLLVEIY